MYKLLYNASSSIAYTIFQTSNDCLKPHTKPNIILNTILRQHYKNVNVRILINSTRAKNIFKPNLSVFEFLSDNGVAVRRSRSGDTVHGKVLIIDSKYLILGSHNLTTRGLMDNYEASCFIHSKNFCKSYLSWFDWLWNRSKESF